MTHEIHLPEHLVGGTYASGWRVSSTGETFMLDFIVADDRHDGPDLIVVDRVRVPAYVIEQMMDALNAQWNAYLGQGR